MPRSALDTIFEVNQMIISTRSKLEALSRAFRRVGNEAIADELDEAAAGLFEASCKILNMEDADKLFDAFENARAALDHIEART